MSKSLTECMRLDPKRRAGTTDLSGCQDFVTVSGPSPGPWARISWPHDEPQAVPPLLTCGPRQDVSAETPARLRGTFPRKRARRSVPTPHPALSCGTYRAGRRASCSGNASEWPERVARPAGTVPARPGNLPQRAPDISPALVIAPNAAPKAISRADSGLATVRNVSRADGRLGCGTPATVTDRKPPPT
jgi:hypothetical protein